MKIITWNINSVRLRLNLIEKFVLTENPDVIALQEIKAADEFFPHEAIRKLGFNYMVFKGEKSYNGVAILSKFPIKDSFSLKFYNDDMRHVACIINDIEIHNFYIPAGGDEPDIAINPKFKHKLEYIKSIQDWFITNRNKNDKIILVGDLNIAPHEHDVWSSKQLKNVVSHTAIERKMLIDLQNSLEFIDTARHFIPMNEKSYSWWSYRNKEWEKSNRGRRLDHIWVSTPLKNSLVEHASFKDVRGWDRPSDHVPIMLELKL